MTSRHTLIIGGLILIFIGINYGFFHAGFMVNSLREARLERIQLALDYAHKREMEQAYNFLKEANDIQILWERHMDVHTHVTLTGFQSLLFATLLPYINLNQKLLFILSFFLVSGGFFLPFGIFLETIGFEKPGFFVALLGGSWVYLATVGYLLGIIRGIFRAK